MKHQHKVNFLANPEDLEVLVLARLGQTTASIAERTKLSPSQVQYRVIEGGGRWCRRAFRNGDCVEFAWCLSSLYPRVKANELHKIKSALGKRIAA